MYNNKFKYDVKLTAEDKKVFLGEGFRPSTPLKIQVDVIASFFLSK